MSGDYPKFPPISRFNREWVITEKIDGTNGLISIEPIEGGLMRLYPSYVTAEHEGQPYQIRAGSRKRWVTPDDDNFGFARWVYDNAQELVKLGVGLHYGEWWGSGIQRGYGLQRGEKRFSLFNVSRWSSETPSQYKAVLPDVDGLGVVPVLDSEHILHPDRLGDMVEEALVSLSRHGSVAAPGYDNPEGIVLYHGASNSLFKMTLDGDQAKSASAA